MQAEELLNARGQAWMPKRQTAELRTRAEAGEEVTLTAGQFLSLLRTLDHAHAKVARYADLQRRFAGYADLQRRFAAIEVQFAQLRVEELAGCLREATAEHPNPSGRWLRALRIAGDPSPADGQTALPIPTGPEVEG